MIRSQHHYNRYTRFIGSLRGQSVDGYAEVHHIVPRSLGGSDDADTLAARSAIRAASDANEAAITACTSVDALAALQMVWPSDKNV